MRKLLLLIVVAGLAAGGWWYWKGQQTEKGPEIVETRPLGRGTVREVLDATGIVKSQVGAQVKIGARTSGVIEQMLVKIGDRVEQGDLIATIDDREQMARERELRARLDRAQTEVDRVNAVYPLRIDEAEAQLQLAEAQLDYAEKTLKRQQQLVKSGLAPQDSLDQATQDTIVARNQYAANRATLARTSEEFRQDRFKTIRSLSEAEAALETAQIQISYTRILSPINGTVSQVAAQEGETIVSGLQVSNLITILDPTRLEMWIYVDETDVGQVQEGMPVEFTVDAYSDKTFYGSIDRVYPEPEIRDNIVYYQAIVSLTSEQAELLRPEMTTQCKIVVKTKDDVLALPNRALKWIGDRKVVFVQEANGTIREVIPQLGLQGPKMSEVLDGLKEGELVGVKVSLQSAGKKSSGKGKR